MVLLQQPVEDLDSRGRAHGPALHLAVGVEAVIQRDVRPSVRIHHRLIEFDMDGPHPRDVGVGAVGDLRIIGQVVEARQTEVAAQHDLSALVVEGAVRCECGKCSFLQKWERLDTRCRCVYGCAVLVDLVVAQSRWADDDSAAKPPEDDRECRELLIECLPSALVQSRTSCWSAQSPALRRGSRWHSAAQ